MLTFQSEYEYLNQTEQHKVNQNTPQWRFNMTSEAQSITKVKSTQYGELEFREHQIFSLPKGLIGLEGNKNYGIVKIIDSSLHIFHSLDEDSSLILVPAGDVVQDYEFEISEEAIQLLEAKQTEDIIVFLIVNMVEGQLYVNLKAPLLLSPSKLRGLQYVIHDQDYPIRYLLSMKGNE